MSLFYHHTQQASNYLPLKNLGDSIEDDDCCWEFWTCLRTVRVYRPVMIFGYKTDQKQYEIKD
jgi:hypothetical protein